MTKKRRPTIRAKTKVRRKADKYRTDGLSGFDPCIPTCRVFKKVGM